MSITRAQICRAGGHANSSIRSAWRGVYTHALSLSEVFVSHHHPLSHLLVGTQFSGIALACFTTAPQTSWLWLIFCAAGIVLGVTTLFFNRPGNFSVYPEVKDRARLITHGPYRYVRHPMYVALVVMMIGIACYNSEWHNAIGLLLVTTAVVFKARREEQLLPQVFPEYPRYAATTGMFLPRLKAPDQ